MTNGKRGKKSCSGQFLRANASAADLYPSRRPLVWTGAGTLKDTHQQFLKPSITRPISWPVRRVHKRQPSRAEQRHYKGGTTQPLAVGQGQPPGVLVEQRL